MCGATGEVRLDGRTPDISAVAAMTEVMVPRGPDSAGVWSQGRVALGHRRLKIIEDAALARAREQHPEVLIEQHAQGDDLRLVVIDGRVVAAALRVPAEVTGTGRHTIRELIEAQSRRRAAAEAIGIPVTGIDLLVPDVTQPEYAFIEANERPGLANHEPQPTAKAFVDFLFPGQPGLPQAWTPDEVERTESS